MSKPEQTSEWQPLGFAAFSIETPEEQAKLAKKNTVPMPPSDRQQLSEASDINEWDNESTKLREIAQQEAYQQGFILGKEEGFAVGKQAGYEEGYQSGRQQIELKLSEQIEAQKMIALETITQLVANFNFAIQQMDEKTVPKLISIALIAAKKMIGQIPQHAHKQLKSLIEELMNQYPPFGENIQLRINQNDLSSIESLLTEKLTKYGWRLVIDPSIESGGCRLLSDRNEIDATLASRWQAITHSAFKDNL